MTLSIAPETTDIFGRKSCIAWGMDYQPLRDRTFDFGVRVIRFCGTLSTTWEARRIAAQLFDSATSVGANYRSACRARSQAEFIARISIVIEEADEAEFWLALLKAANLCNNADRETLAREAAELRAIFVASRNTARTNPKYLRRHSR